MSVRILISPAGSGKTGHVLDIFKQFTPSEQCDSVRLIVPTISYVIQQRRLLLSDPEFPGLLGDPITTFYEFAKDFLISSGLTHPKPISEMQRLSILRKVVKNAPSNYFDNIRNCPNFPDALGGIINSLKSAAISPDDLLKATESSDIVGNSKRKISDLAALYRAYENELTAENMHDRDDVIRRALDMAKENPGLLQGYKCIILDGFSTFAPVQQKLIRLFAGHSGELIITLDYEENRSEVFSSIEPTMQFLRELPGTTVEQISREQKDSVLAHLGKYLFHADAPQIMPDESITILTGSTPFGEIELVAERIKKLVRENGFQYEDFALISRSIGPYRQKIQSIFRQYGIPLETYSYPLSGSRLAREVLQNPDVKPDLNSLRDEQELKENCAAWKAIQRIIAETKETPDLLESAIREREYRMPGSPDGVALLDANMLRGRKFKVIFIVGMLDRTFPRQIREDPLLSDSERRALNTHLPHALRLREQEGDYEKYLFHTAVTSAQDFLFLTHPLTDSPSRYLHEADRLFLKNIKRVTHEIVPPIERAETKEALLASTILGCCNSRDEESKKTAATYNLLLEKGLLSAENFEWLGKVEKPELDEAVEVAE